MAGWTTLGPLTTSSLSLTKVQAHVARTLMSCDMWLDVCHVRSSFLHACIHAYIHTPCTCYTWVMCTCVNLHVQLQLHACTICLSTCYDYLCLPCLRVVSADVGCIPVCTRVYRVYRCIVGLFAAGTVHVYMYMHKIHVYMHTCIHYV